MICHPMIQFGEIAEAGDVTIVLISRSWSESILLIEVAQQIMIGPGLGRSSSRVGV